MRELEALLRQGQDNGEFRDFDARAMAIMIRGAITAAVQRIDNFDVDGYRRELVSTFDRATRRS